MKKITAFIGTESKKNTYRAVQEFEKNLKQLGEIDFDYVFLSDYHLEFCRGCKICFNRGEEYCPLKDDRDILLGKLEDSDGVIFATPSYAFHITARMKNFFDRTAFTNHRPRYFDKVCTAIVTHGVPFGGKFINYLYDAGANMGFRTSKGCCINSLEPMTELQQKKLIREVTKTSTRFYRELLRPTPPPSFFRLMLFRMTRQLVKSAGEEYRDYHYYKEKGWLKSDYYYATTLGTVIKLVGNFFDFIGRKMVKQQREIDLKN